MNSINPIDAVVAWVDGSDPNWRKEKRKYLSMVGRNMDDSEERYRDWDSFRYWFRGIENYAPWIRKVFLVTWGHVPKWLNTDCEKLEIVCHEDYIPNEYLPTFSSHTIELNLHRIKDLSDKFIYFNDDMFIINSCRAEDFFKNGIPCDSAVLCPHCYSRKDMILFTPFVNIGIINDHFNMKEVIKSNISKWFSIKYNKYLLSNMMMLSCPRFPGMRQQHLPQPFLKSTFQEVWEIEGEELDNTCRHKFRDKLDVNQWLMREWQIAEGNFIPRKVNVGKSFMLSNIEEICSYIEEQKGKMICINDSEMSVNSFNEHSVKVENSFSKILPKKSKFEL